MLEECRSPRHSRNPGKPQGRKGCRLMRLGREHGGGRLTKAKPAVQLEMMLTLRVRVPDLCFVEWQTPASLSGETVWLSQSCPGAGAADSRYLSHSMAVPDVLDQQPVILSRRRGAYLFHDISYTRLGTVILSLPVLPSHPPSFLISECGCTMNLEKLLPNRRGGGGSGGGAHRRLEKRSPRFWAWFAAVVAAIILVVSLAVGLGVGLSKRNRSPPASVMLPLYIYPADNSTWKPAYDAYIPLPDPISQPPLTRNPQLPLPPRHHLHRYRQPRQRPRQRQPPGPAVPHRHRRAPPLPQRPSPRLRPHRLRAPRAGRCPARRGRVCRVARAAERRGHLSRRGAACVGRKGGGVHAGVGGDY